MNNFLSKLTSWFKPKSKPKKLSPEPKPKLTQEVKPIIKPVNSYNSKYYRQLIGKLARWAIAIQRRRTQARRKF